MSKPVVFALLLIAVACAESKTAATPADAQSPADASSSAEIQASKDSAASADGQAAADAVPASWSLPPSKPAGALTVLTYNVMCSFCVNSSHPEWQQKWADRLPWLQDVFVRFDPDLMGLQELQDQVPPPGGITEVDQILGQNSPYAAHYYKHQPGDDLPGDYPDATLFWKKARFDKIGDGVVWLSPTPDKSFSIGFGKSFQFPRLMIWVKLHDKVANRDLYFANTHFDNNAPSQEKSSPLVMKTLGPLTKDAPLIATGDYNADTTHVAYKLLTAGQPPDSPPWQDAFALAKKWTIVHNQDSQPAYAEKARIDHIFLVSPTAKFQVAWWGIDLWLYGPMHQAPSDHDGAIVAYVEW